MGLLSEAESPGDKTSVQAPGADNSVGEPGRQGEICRPRFTLFACHAVLITSVGLVGKKPCCKAWLNIAFIAGTTADVIGDSVIFNSYILSKLGCFK